MLPIYEPGLEELVERNQAAGRLTFTTDVGRRLADSDVVFIAVGTPPDEDGSADLRHVLAVAETIGKQHDARDGRRHQVDRARRHGGQGARRGRDDTRSFRFTS